MANRWAVARWRLRRWVAYRLGWVPWAVGVVLTVWLVLWALTEAIVRLIG